MNYPKRLGLNVNNPTMNIYELTGQHQQDFEDKRNTTKILQIEIIKKPKNFSEKLEFKIKTDLPSKDTVSFSIMDSDTLFINKGSRDDTELVSNNSLRLGSAKYFCQFTEEMQKKAFKDTEFYSAECYIKIYHPKTGYAYSKIFDVAEYEFKKYMKKENWKIKSILDLIKNANEGKLDSKRNCDLCCLNALASNLKTLYLEKSPKKIPTNDTMSASVKSLEKKYFSDKIIIAPTYQNKRLTSKSFDISNSKDFLDNVKPKIEEKLLSLTGSNEICIFAVGIAAEYHSTLVVVSKNKDFKIKLKNEEIFGSNDNPLFLFVEDVSGCRSFRKKELDKKINEFISGAYFFYSGKKEVGGLYYSHPERDISLDACIYQLYKPI